MCSLNRGRPEGAEERYRISCLLPRSLCLQVSYGFHQVERKGSLPQCLPILGTGSPGHAIGFSPEIKRQTSRGHKPSRLQDTWGCSRAKLHRQAVVAARNADLYKKSKEIWSFKNGISQFLNIGSIKNKIKRVFGLHLVASLSL